MYSEKLKKLPPYLFVELDRKKKMLLNKGIDIISLGVGDPDLPIPSHILNSIKYWIDNPKYHKYPFGAGLIEFRTAIALWFKERFNVVLNPETEIYSLIGSKEGIGHLPLAFVNPGDIVLVPDPGYPVYYSSTIFAGGIPYFMPLLKQNNFLPDIDSIPVNILNKTKIMFLNYPNNPTTVTATKEFFIRIVELAQKYNFIVSHDAAYSEIYFDNNPPISFLSINGAKEIGIEFHSLSKTYNMTGFRIGWVCGSEKIIKGLATVKENFDSGVFEVIQKAGITALTESQECVQKIRKTYQERRDIFVDGLLTAGWNLKKPQATFYVWSECPKNYTSAQTSEKLLLEAGIVVTPGVGMGCSGEGYVRFALTVDKSRLKEVIERIKKIKW